MRQGVKGICAALLAVGAMTAAAEEDVFADLTEVCRGMAVDELSAKRALACPVFSMGLDGVSVKLDAALCDGEMAVCRFLVTAGRHDTIMMGYCVEPEGPVSFADETRRMFFREYRAERSGRPAERRPS